MAVSEGVSQGRLAMGFPLAFELRSKNSQRTFVLGSNFNDGYMFNLLATITHSRKPVQICMIDMETH